MSTNRQPRGGWLSGFDPGRPGVRALAAIAAVAALVAAVIAWQSRPEPAPVPRAPAASGPADPGPTVTSGSGVVVAVSGRVRFPGLVRLPVGARVADALQAAGGVLPGTDVTMMNVARLLADGELIVVGVAVPTPMPSGPVGSASPGRVNLNTATVEQLQSLPGVGPVLAQRIVDFRQAHGGFRSVADLRQVTGIGDAKFGELKDRVTV